MTGTSAFFPASAPAWRFVADLPARFRSFIRLVSILCRTGWAVLSLAFGRPPAVALHLWARDVVRVLGLRVEILGLLDGVPQLWAANHLSWLDPLVLLGFRPMGALAKSEVADYPLIGPASRRMGLTFVDRLDARSRAAAVVRLAADLRGGRPVLLFPEGTTTVGRRLAPLQEGGLRAAFRCGASIQPIRLSCADHHYPWTGENTLLPHLLQVARAPSTPLRLEAGRPLDPGQFPDEDQWVEAIRRQLTPLA